MSLVITLKTVLIAKTVAECYAVHYVLYFMYSLANFLLGTPCY